MLQLEELRKQFQVRRWGLQGEEWVLASPSSGCFRPTWGWGLRRKVGCEVPLIPGSGERPQHPLGSLSDPQPTLLCAPGVLDTSGMVPAATHPWMVQHL